MKTRTTLTVLALAGVVSLAACDTRDQSVPTDRNSNNNNTNTTAPSGTTPSSTTPSTTTPGTTPSTPARTAPENTGLNKRDADGTTKTPMDQGNNQADIDMTATIRRAIVDNKSMSTNARNCKIITEKGVVTLRGIVDSQAEKDSIATIANSTPGVVRVVNELEVKQP